MSVELASTLNGFVLAVFCIFRLGQTFSLESFYRYLIAVF